MKAYSVSCTAFTVEVETDDQDIVTRAAPVVRKFVGKPFGNLLTFARKLGCCEYRRLSVQPGLFAADESTSASST